MPINIVNYGQRTLIDLSNDTITPDKVLSGYTGHDKTGALITGTAAGEIATIGSFEQFQENWDSEDGFFISYNNETDGIFYITNAMVASKGIFVEDPSITNADPWYLEQISGYTDRFYLYTYVNNQKMYIYNNTSAGANFAGLSTTDKASFTVTQPEPGHFLFKISTANKWFQHSKGGGGMRFYTDANNIYNTRMIFTYRVNAIVPYGTLTITENGTYDVYNYKSVIVNI